MTQQPKTYTQQEVNDIIREHTERIESAQFETQTKEVLTEINKRLNESNNYKATIGKDLRDLKVKFEATEINRAAEASRLATELIHRGKIEDKKHTWWQDRWIRIGIIGAIVWEVINIYQAAGGSVPHHGL